MPIDDPISAARQQIEAEARKSSPVTAVVVDLALAVELIPGVGPIQRFIERHRKSNADLMISTVQQEMYFVIAHIEQLETNHQRFLRTEFMALVVDGIKRAENLRSQDRV